MSITLENKLAIHELLSRAAYGYDERDTNILAQCFAENASFTMRISGADELVGPFEGRDGIMELMTSSMASQSDVRRHVISNIFFTPSTDDVEVISNLTLLATENNEIQLISSGVYRDRVSNEDGQWRITHRHLDLDKGY